MAASAFPQTTVHFDGAQYHHQFTPATPPSTAADLREYANKIEADEKAARKAAKAKAREAKAAARRRHVALDALVRVAQGDDDMAAVEAARTILNGGIA